MLCLPSSVFVDLLTISNDCFLRFGFLIRKFIMMLPYPPSFD